MNRDYSTISPSAKSLLLMKALTTIPYMKAAAELACGKPAVKWMETRLTDDMFLKSLLHFEERYCSVDNLLKEFGGNHVLEISSGFSFRGLNATIQNPSITYIDTDLKELIDTKLSLTDQLVSSLSLDLQGELMIHDLNVLDEAAFNSLVGQFSPGPVTIVNEGLLMYLEPEEKIKLCKNIHAILKQRGGCWITADIYIKKEFYQGARFGPMSDFLEKHKVEEKKFDSFEQAELFFAEQGLRILKKAEPAYKQLSSWRYFSEEKIAELRAVSPGGKFRVRETWALGV